MRLAEHSAVRADTYDDLGVQVSASDVRRGRRVVPAARMGTSWIEQESITSMPVVIGIGGLAIAVQGSAAALAVGVLVFLGSALWLGWQVKRQVLCVDVDGRTWELATTRDRERLERLQQQIDIVRPASSDDRAASL